MGFNKGVFGSDRRRAERRTMAVMAAFWILVVFYGIACYFLFSTPLFTFPVLYIGGMYGVYLWHWMVHQKWLFYPMWKVHMYHHHVIYPISRFLSKEYMDDRNGRTFWTSVAHDGPLYLLLLANLVALYSTELLKPADAALGVVFYGIIGSYGNWLHHTFHVDGHWMESFLWFHDLRANHFTHHAGTTQINYGFLDFAWDSAMKTSAPGNYVVSNAQYGKVKLSSYSDIEGLKEFLEIKTGKVVDTIRNKGNLVRDFEGLAGVTSLDITFRGFSKDVLTLAFDSPDPPVRDENELLPRPVFREPHLRHPIPRWGTDKVGEVLAAWLTLVLDVIIVVLLGRVSDFFGLGKPLNGYGKAGKTANGDKVA